MKKEFSKTSKKAKPYLQKFKPPELKPVDEVKALFRNYFKQHQDTGHVMSKQTVIQHVLKKLTAKEDAVFADALAALTHEGFIDILEDGVSLMLTQKGSDSFKN